MTTTHAAPHEHRNGVTRAFGRLAGFLFRNTMAVLVASLVVSVIAFMGMRSLELKSSFIDLLPENHPAVNDLRSVSDRLGGFGFLIVTVESQDMEAAKRFARDLSAALSKVPEVRYADYRIHKEFFENRKLLYVSLEDLRTIRDRIKAKFSYEKRRLNPLAISLGTEKPVGLDFSDIEKKYAGMAGRSDYHISQDNTMLVILVKPSSPASDVAFSRQLTLAVRARIDALNPQSYHPSMKVGLTGRYQNNIDDNETLKRDIKFTSALALVVILFLVTWVYHSFRAGVLLFVPMLMSLCWTFGVARISLGYLNVITGFLAAVLLGMGIEYEIFLLTRYIEERRQGREVDGALHEAIAQTGAPITASMLTTATAFFALMVSGFRGFSEFGWLAGIGVVLNWIGTFTVLPCLLLIGERIKPMRLTTRLPEAVILGKELKAWRWTLLVSVVLTLFLAVGASQIKFDYMFSKLGSKTRDSFALRDKVNRIFGMSLTPSPVVLDSLEDARLVARELRRRVKENPDTTIDKVISIYVYLPQEQEEHLRVIREIRDCITNTSIRVKSGSLKKQIDELKRLVEVDRAVSINDLPAEVIRQFTDSNGERGKFVYIYPRVDFSDAKAVLRFAEEIREIKYAKDKPPARGVGEEILFAEVLRLIRQRGPIALALTFFAVFVIVWLQFGKFPKAVIVMVPVVVGMLWACGIMGVSGATLNFMNIVMFPTFIGMGIDFGINFYQRYMEEGPGSLRHVFRATGFSIGLAALCNMVGFGMLMVADHRGLNTIGQLAIIGIACIFIVSVTFFPAMLQAYEFYKKRGPYARN